MSKILSLGAINKNTKEYVCPKMANKKDKYSCPDCDKDLILCQGKIKVPHFRHKVDNVNPCHYYSKPGESQIHKDAKCLIKSLLEKKKEISFIRNCDCCKKNEEFEIEKITETSSIIQEYPFKYNNSQKFADVAYIDDGEIYCIFEICNTHKTCSENRPEPWFEIDAKTLIIKANDINSTSLQIPCIRSEKCEDCIKKKNEFCCLDNCSNAPGWDGLCGHSWDCQKGGVKSMARKQRLERLQERQLERQLERQQIWQKRQQKRQQNQSNWEWRRRQRDAAEVDSD